MAKSWSASLVYHRGNTWIGVHFPKNRSLILRFRSQFPQAVWSKTHKLWLIEDTSEHRNRFLLSADLHLFTQVLEYQLKPILLSQENHREACRYYRHLVLKAYSASTIRTYVGEFLRLLHLLKTKPVQALTSDQYASYLHYLRTKCAYSESALHTSINALKFYTQQILENPVLFEVIPRPKKQQQLPHVLSQKELKQLFDSLENRKHRVLLMTAFSAGLRVSEVVNLRVADVDSERMTLFIRQGKGKKDRVVALSEVLLKELRLYVRDYQPKEFLFEGQDGGAYSVRSVQAIMKKAKKWAGLHKPGSVHSLRHAYATHLLESGTDIRFIQELLGHKDIKTTQIYTHVAVSKKTKIRSPLDDF